MATRKDRNRNMQQYQWSELCSDEEELNRILNLPEIQRESIFDEKIAK